MFFMEHLERSALDLTYIYFFERLTVLSLEHSSDSSSGIEILQ